MLKKWICCFAAMALLLSSAALAEVYSGSVVAAFEQKIVAQASGILETLEIEAGSVVRAGQVIAAWKPVKVFSELDGVVESVGLEAGVCVNGTVLYVAPEARYTIYCTVDEAYPSVESTLVQSGEQVYIKCTNDGTHRATGIIGAIEGSEYRVWATGGELYIGETVYLYRSADFKSSQKIGIGTVVATDTETYEANGYLLNVYVSEGEAVERGELLYEYVETGYAGAADARIYSASDAVVTEVYVQQGDRVEQGQPIASVAPWDAFCVEVFVSEETAAKVGESVSMIFAADPDETVVSGTVLSVGGFSEDGSYPVRILHEATDNLRLGMTVSVCFEE